MCLDLSGKLAADGREAALVAEKLGAAKKEPQPREQSICPRLVFHVEMKKNDKRFKDKRGSAK